MAKPITAKSFTFEGLKLEGGWTYKVPEIRAVPADEQAYITFWMRPPHNLGRKAATEKVREELQNMLNVRWAQLMGQVVGRAAKTYIQRYPHLEMRGFDPAMIAKAWVPGRENPRFHGKPFYHELMTLMAKEVEDAER